MQNAKPKYKRIDLLLTLAAVLFWLWFGFQHGYGNSPDSWYRGAIARSIVEGRPFWSNVKQGWFYDYGPWHHESTHEPLLPALYALFFLVFGPKILIANILVAVSTGLLLYPALRLSRSIFGSGLPAILAFCFTTINSDNEFLRELISGLAIPTSLLALLTYLYLQQKLFFSYGRGALLGAATALAALYYNRADGQVLFFALAAVSLGFARAAGGRDALRRLAGMWAAAFILVLPWMLRKYVLFGNPFFRDTVPMLWADRPADYYDYHEAIAFPSASTYFEHHTVADFLRKIFVTNASNTWFMFNEATNNLGWGFGAAFVLSAALCLKSVKDPGNRLTVVTLIAAVLGSFGILVLASLIDKRFFIIPFFGIAFLAFGSLGLLLKIIVGSGRPVRGVLLSWAVGTCVFAALHLPFLQRFYRDAFPFAYTLPDSELAQDPTIQELRERIPRDAVVLGPFSEVQRLNFATGRTLIEQPANLDQIKDLPGFLRRYRVAYSLVDLSRRLPHEMIGGLELLGNAVLTSIRFDAPSGVVGKPVENVLSNRMADALSGRRIFWSEYYGMPYEGQLDFLQPVILRSKMTLARDRDRLSNSGVLVLGYSMYRPTLTPADERAVESFVREGGRLLLACPGWVSLAYDTRPLSQAVCNRLSKPFSVIFAGNTAEPPYSSTLPEFAMFLKGRAAGATYSAIVSLEGEVIAEDARKRSLGVRRKIGAARVFAWGQNNLLDPELVRTRKGRAAVREALEWLFDPS